MSFSPEFLDELRGRLRLSEVVGRKVRLTRRGREFVGLCPFHSEKTPSFTVNDDKAFYHCFGCGAHGDVIRFVSNTEGLGFPEAVERLAGEAGLALPARDPRAEEKARQRAGLKDIQAIAAKWFESQLWSASGGAALDYLKRRGLDETTIRRFALGFAPAGRTALLDALKARGMDDRQLRESGLIIYPDDGRAPLDRFRNRVMFPIRDLRGDVVAFGGRALDDATAKYLNSPETPLFHKGQVLYNLDQARQPARETGRILVAEGYMDVIALAQAGIGETVAPLGTALTEGQLTALWRVVAEPVLCFDGDSAGLRAAARVVERALPLLRPGYSLRFALLPSGEDPDSLIRNEGRQAMDKIVAEAQSLADMLWQIATAGASLDTPERRAGLERLVMERLQDIRDSAVQGFYRAEFRRRLGDLFRGPETPGRWRRDSVRQQPAGRSARRPGGVGGDRGGLRPSGRLKGTALARDGAAVRARRREQLLLLCLINHPALLERYAEEIAVLEILNPDLDKLRAEIIGIAALQDSLDMDHLRRHLKAQGWEKLVQSLDAAFASLWFVKPDAALRDVESGWQQARALHHRMLTMERELKALERELAESMTEETFARFSALKAQIDQSEGLEANLEGFGVASGRESSV
ncbi:MAG: DNA primase [Alphaproteobacteria bacterium]|nr:MAG: DNA primase [Alphaproteobacteria bacterium]